ncbi:hypothetical protein CEY05_04345 [Achromobacter sp. HZ34]|nr:hypothetical protein CEY05_04345 [Achromobacter sp. HZ34]
MAGMGLVDSGNVEAVEEIKAALMNVYAQGYGNGAIHAVLSLEAAMSEREAARSLAQTSTHQAE